MEEKMNKRGWTLFALIKAKNDNIEEREKNSLYIQDEVTLKPA